LTAEAHLLLLLLQLEKLDVLLLRRRVAVLVATAVVLDVRWYFLPRDDQTVDVLNSADLLDLPLTSEVVDRFAEDSTLSLLVHWYSTQAYFTYVSLFPFRLPDPIFLILGQGAMTASQRGLGLSEAVGAFDLLVGHASIAAIQEQIIFVQLVTWATHARYWSLDWTPEGLAHAGHRCTVI
jgi:hypothetical protein